MTNKQLSGTKRSPDDSSATINEFDKDIASELHGLKRFWDSFADNYINFNNFSIQVAKVMHDHMKLDSTATTTPLHVLEVASASGIGTEDLLSRNETMIVHATDYSSVMVEQLKEKFTNHPASHRLTIEEANALDLNTIESNSKDRYIAGLCLHLVPQPKLMLQEARRVLKSGGLAVFSIWGSVENSGLFTILEGTTAKNHPNFQLGKNMNEVIHMIKSCGFTNVVYWPVWMIVETLNEQNYVDFMQSCFGIQDTVQLNVLSKRAKEFLQSGKPIALENYVILAQAD